MTDCFSVSVLRLAAGFVWLNAGKRQKAWGHLRDQWLLKALQCQVTKAFLRLAEPMDGRMVSYSSRMKMRPTQHTWKQGLRFLSCILGVPKVIDTEQEWMGVGSGEEDNNIDSSSIAFIKNAFKNLLFIFDNTLIISTPSFPSYPS